MSGDLLERANRDLLRAIEKPPDYDVEGRLDRFAGVLWAFARGDRRPDHGRLARIDRKLAAIEARTDHPTATYVRRTREHLDAYRESLPALP